MKEDKILYDVIKEVLEIHSYSDKLRAINRVRISHEIAYITEMEKLHCQTFPTYRDYKKVLEDLLEKEDVIIHEAERNIAIATLLEGKKKYELDSMKC